MASKTRQNKIAYALWRRPFGSGHALEVKVFPVIAIPVTERLEGTRGNKDGYVDEEVANRLGRIYQQMLDEGIKTIYESSRYNPKYSPVVLRWIELSNDLGVGQADILGIGEDGYIGVKRSVRLLEWIGRAIERHRFKDAKKSGAHLYSEKPDPIGNDTFASPSELMRVLEKSRVVPVELYQHPNMAGTWIARRSPRPWIVSDTLLEIFQVKP